MRKWVCKFSFSLLLTVHIEKNEVIDDGMIADELGIIFDNHDKIQEEEKDSHEVQSIQIESRQREYEDRENSEAVNPAYLDKGNY